MLRTNYGRACALAMIAGAAVFAGCGATTKTVTVSAPAAPTSTTSGVPPQLEHLKQEADKRLKALEREGGAHKRLEEAEARRTRRESQVARAAPESEEGEHAKEEAEEAKKEAEEAKEEAEDAKREAEEAKAETEG